MAHSLISISDTELADLAGSFTREAFEAHLARVRHLPAWWLERKRAAYARFADLPMPRRTDESWRFSSLTGLTLEGFKIPSAAVDFKQTTHSDIGVAGAGTLLFANNRLAMQEPLATPAAARGVVFDTLQNALLKHGDLVREHLLAQPPKLGSAKFAALHEAFLEDGAFIYVPKDVEVELPVGVFHYGAGPGAALFPHTLIVADERARITVADSATRASCRSISTAAAGKPGRRVFPNCRRRARTPRCSH